MSGDSKALTNLQGEPERKWKREASSQTDDKLNNSLVAEMKDSAESDSSLANSWQEDMMSKINKLLEIHPMIEELKQKLKEPKRGKWGVTQFS